MKELRDNFRRVALDEFFYVTGAKKQPSHVEYNGRTRKIANPIDYLLYVLRWDMMSVDQYITQVWPDLVEKNPYTANKSSSMYDTIKKEITMQWDYLGVQSARIQAIDTVNNNTPPKPIYKHKGHDFLNLEELFSVLKYLMHLNANNHHIYMQVDERIDNNPMLILIDDFNMAKYDDLVKSVGLPNMILETSKDNFQILYKIERREDEKRRQAINAFNSLNNTFGDKECNGLRHPFRLAGFRNKKAGKEGFMTRIVAARRDGADEMESYVDSCSTEKIKRDMDVYQDETKMRISSFTF